MNRSPMPPSQSAPTRTPPPIRPAQRRLNRNRAICATVAGVILLILLFWLIFTLLGNPQTANQGNPSTENESSNAEEAVSAAKESDADSQDNAETDTSDEETSDDSVNAQEQSTPTKDAEDVGTAIDSNTSSSNTNPDESAELTEKENRRYQARATGGLEGAFSPVNQNVGFFGIRSSGNHIAYVIDKSGSMNGSRFELAKKELLASLSDFSEQQTFSIYLFDSTAIFETRFINCSADAKKIDRLKRWLSSINPNGSTDPIPALQIAFNGDCDLIFLLSDGEFDNRRARVKALNQNEVPVNTVSMQVESESLKQVAKRNHGQYRRVQSP